MKKPKEILIGAKLKGIRRSHGYTQEKLAEAIECSTRYIGNIEQDKSKPSYEILVKICNLFDIGLDDIFSEHLEKTGKKARNVELEAFSKIKPKNQDVILHLIEYFNKNDK